jgi:hypothetical protein
LLLASISNTTVVLIKKNTVVHGSTGAGPTLARPSSKGKAFVAHQTKEVVAKGLIALAPLIPFEIIY